MKCTLTEECGEYKTVQEANTTFEDSNDEVTFVDSDWLSVETVRYSWKKMVTLEILIKKAEGTEEPKLVKEPRKQSVN